MDWIRKQLDAIGGQGTSAEVIGGIILAIILAISAIAWRRLVRRLRTAEAEAVRAETEESPKPSDSLTLSERRVLARMYKGKREIRILRSTDSPALFVQSSGYVESSPTSLVADRWFFVLKGLAARELVSHGREKLLTNGLEVEVFALNEKGLKRCISLFGGPIRATVMRAWAWLAEWWGFVVWVAVMGGLAYLAYKHQQDYGGFF